MILFSVYTRGFICRGFQTFLSLIFPQFIYISHNILTVMDRPKSWHCHYLALVSDRFRLNLIIYSFEGEAENSLTNIFGHTSANKRFNIDCEPYFCGESVCSGRDLWSDRLSVTFKASADVTLLLVTAGTLWSQVNLNEVFQLTCYTVAREACNASSDRNYLSKFTWAICSKAYCHQTRLTVCETGPVHSNTDGWNIWGSS